MNQVLLLISIITMISYRMTITRHEMARKEAGSRVKFRVTNMFPTTLRTSLPGLATLDPTTVSHLAVTWGTKVARAVLEGLLH